MSARNKKRPEINPREIRKASDFRKEQAYSSNPVGKRERTPNGYKIEGAACKEFETFVEFVGNSQTTAKVMHPKKTRALRVLAGQGFVLLEEDGVPTSTVLMPGRTVVIKPGVAYRIATTSKQELELLVIQSSKYAYSMKTLEETSSEASLDSSKLHSLTPRDALAEQLPTPRRRRSKAALQQLDQAGARGRGSAPERALRGGDQSTAVNLPPTHGQDLRGAEG